MPELMLELFSEEIPARLQAGAASALKKAVTEALVNDGLTYEGAAAFVTPRRLALTVTGIPASSPDTLEEKRGPRTDAPQKAIEGFLRGAGLASIDQAQTVSDPKKGEFYLARIERKGEAAKQILARVLPQVIEGFGWAKSMRWGRGEFTWVRPLRAITATFGTENDEPEIVEFEVAGLKAGQTTFGHRFLAPDAIRVKRFSDYQTALEKAHVVLDSARRRDIIATDADNLAFAQGLELVADAGLLQEVAGLVEWPVVMMGTFSEQFLQLPEEVIIATIRTNQKCFCLRNRTTGKLAPNFILTANTAASDGGKTIIAGNERVIRARLSDAMFFYENDLATPLETGLPRLVDMVFHAKLGTQADRVERIVELASEIAAAIGANKELARRAAQLAKADLVTEMVFEFPELQGLMGRYYAAAQGEDTAVATAIEMHYKPLGPSDAVPTEPVSIVVALADKLDLLTGFWAIDEKPTGSRDPFALRRAALGVIRILVENEITYPLDVEADLLSFFHDRLKVMLRDSGARHDLVDAVLADAPNDMLEISRRVVALSDLLDTETGQSLLAGYRRGANILAAEEKKDGRTYTGEIDTAKLAQEEELALARAVATTHSDVATYVADRDYKGAIGALSGLRDPVDAFFDNVMVNDEDADIRTNRLHLLARLRDTMHSVADFSKVEG